MAKVLITEMKPGTRFFLRTDDGKKTEFMRTDRTTDLGWALAVRLDTGHTVYLPSSYKALAL